MSMELQMKEFVEAYLKPLRDAAQGKSSDIAEKVEKFEGKMRAAAEEAGDFVAFASGFAASDLNWEYSSLIMEASVAGPAGDVSARDESAGAVSEGYGLSALDQADQGQGTSLGQEVGRNSQASTISVRDYVEQYRPQYEEVKKSGVRRETEKLYEKILALPGETEDMLTAQLILEKEGWLRELSAVDNKVLLHTAYEAMDKKDPTISAITRANIKAAKEATCPEEYSYLSAVYGLAVQGQIQKAYFEFELLVGLASAICAYVKCKARIWEEPDDRQILGGNLAGMKIYREKAKLIYRQLEACGIDEEKIKGDSLLQLYFLCGRAIGGSLGKYKGTLLPPSTLESYFSLYHEEIDSPMSLAECVKHKHRLFYQANPTRSFSDEERDRIEGELGKEISEMDYYKLGQRTVGLAQDLPDMNLMD